jgi:hypothetical protein
VTVAFFVDLTQIILWKTFGPDAHMPIICPSYIFCIEKTDRNNAQVGPAIQFPVKSCANAKVAVANSAAKRLPNLRALDMALPPGLGSPSTSACP